MINNNDRLLLLKEALQSTIKGNQDDKIREEMKGIFPTLWNDIVGYFHDYAPTLNPILASEEKLMKKYCNANFNFLLNSNPERKVIMYPSKYATNTLLGTLFQPVLSIATAVQAIQSGEADLILNNSRNVNGKIIIPQTDIQFNVIQSKGFYDTFYGKEKERFSVYLSLIGNTANMKYMLGTNLIVIPTLLTGFLLQLNTVTPTLKDQILPFVIGAFILFAILLMYLNRNFIWQSDDFVKKMGYGEEYANAISLISQVRQDSNVIIKYKDMMVSIGIELHNLLESLGPVTFAPGKQKRITNLLGKKESYSYKTENFMPEIILNGLENAFHSIEKYLAVMLKEIM